LRHLPIGPVADDAILGNDTRPGVGGQLFVLAEAERNEYAGFVETAHGSLLRAHLRPVFIKSIGMRARIQYAIVIAHGVLGKRNALLPLVDFQLVQSERIVIRTRRQFVWHADTRFRQLIQNKPKADDNYYAWQNAIATTS